MKNVFILIFVIILSTCMICAQCNPRVTVTEHIYQSPCGHTACDFYLASSGVDTITFMTGGGIPLFYTFGVSPRGTLANPTIDTLHVFYPSAGSVVVTANAQDAINGCRASFNGPAFNAVIDTPVVQPICLVTVDSATDKPLVVWEKVNRDATINYNIYRANAPDSIYNRVGTVLGDSLSAWVDSSALPDSMSYRYKISYMDTCGNVSAMSPYHQTLYLTSLGAGNFSWTPYTIEGDTLPLGTYDFYKDSTCQGDWRLLSSVPYTQTTAFDASYGVYPCSNYKVVLTLANPCNPGRSFSSIASNVYRLLPTAISDNFRIEQIKVQPNPTRNYLTISCSDYTVDNRLVSITDAMGQLVYTSPMNSDILMVNTQNWQSGVYFVAVSSSRGKATLKVLK